MENNFFKIIRDRKSTRSPFDTKRKIKEDDLHQILDAARWTPTPHNMQNFEIIVVDSKKILKKIGNIKVLPTEAFIRENFSQLSMSIEELRKKKTGILGKFFPPEWRDKTKLNKAIKERTPSPLNDTLQNGPTLLIIIYDNTKRAPDSPGDFLGIVGLGCLMENIWLAAESLEMGVHILSEFGEDPIDKEVKQILKIPNNMDIAYAVRLGYPKNKNNNKYVRNVRIRRDLSDFTHKNIYGEKSF
jgi:nitroreductase